MANVRDKEELLSALFVGYVVPEVCRIALIGTSPVSNADVIRRANVKRDALERYMRTYLRALTVGELEDWLEDAESRERLRQGIPHELRIKIGDAARGFDRYVSKRKYPSLVEA